MDQSHIIFFANSNESKYPCLYAYFLQSKSKYMCYSEKCNIVARQNHVVAVPVVMAQRFLFQFSCVEYY